MEMHAVAVVKDEPRRRDILKPKNHGASISKFLSFSKSRWRPLTAGTRYVPAGTTTDIPDFARFGGLSVAPRCATS